MAKVRTGSGRVLPAIQSSYADEYPDPTGRDPYAIQAWNTPRGAENRAISRIQDFEGRLQAQEMTTKTLIERAYKIKEDIIDNLNITHATWQEEKRNRELLQEHIRTITDVVRKLNKDITDLEKGIEEKDAAMGGMQENLKSLELHHVAGLTDIRGRVARCDASIARLAADLKGCFDFIRSLNQNQTDQNAKMLERLGHIDSKINELFTRMEKNQTENEINIRHVEADTGNQMTGMDSRTRQMLEETRGMLHTFKAIESSEREKLETRLSIYVDQHNIVRDQRQDRFERSADETFGELSRRVASLEEQNQRERDRALVVVQNLEGKFERIIEDQRKKFGADIGTIKRDCKDGFSVVHESITNMKQIMDGKRKLLEEQIRKEIAQIRKMVVLI